MNEYKPDRLLNRYFVYTWLVAFTLQISQSTFNVTSASYLVSRGFSNTFAGTLALFYAIFAIFGRLASAYICDFKSRRLSIVLGCGMFAVVSVLFSIPALALAPLLIIIRGAHGFGYAASTTGYYAAAIDVSPPDKISLGLALNSSGMAVAQLVCGVTATVLVFGTNYVPLYLFAAVIAALAAVFGLLCSYESKYHVVRSSRAEFRIHFNDVIERKALPGAMLTFIYFISISAAMFFSVSRANAAGYQAGSLFFTVSAVSTTLANLVIAKIVDRLGRIAVMIPLCIVSSITMFLLAALPSFGLLLLAGVLYGFAMCAIPIILNCCVEGLPQNRRGAGTSTFYIAMDLSMGVGPILWGALIDGFGFSTSYFAAGVISLCVIATLPFTLKKKPEVQAE